MAREATGSLVLALSVLERNTAIGAGGTGTVEHAISVSRSWGTGTADGQIDRVYSTTGTASTTPTDVDVAGSLSSVIGAGTTTFVEVVAVAIQNTGSVALRVGGDANAITGLFGATNDLLVVPAGGTLLLDLGTAGLTPTAGTGDILQIDTASSTTTYKLVIVGRSA